ncbi:sulfurtransferase [Litoribaculum gwangyangense]|uniref:Sulfurtransferase n=1 Tax=Litoribaculum gwangyangense TaxID=1130722 RepID=A0ABP9CFB5_9FLAO
MNLRIDIIVIILLFFGCKKVSNQSPIVVEDDLASIVTNQYLIETEELSLVINNPNIKLIDFRTPELYSEGHLPGAINIWRYQVEDDSYPYGGMMASKSQIETLFGGLGISNDNTIIIYDDNGLCDSSRLWWILQNYDFTNTKLFHGGINAWKKRGGVLTKELPTLIKTTFKLPENASMKYYISKENLLSAMGNNVKIFDTRTEDEFSGKRQKKGAFRGGHIPNSKNIDWSRAIDYYGDMKLKPKGQLNEIYKKFASKDDTIIAYCHSGVRSAHTTFVLTQILGYQNVKNYDGSWIEWSYFNDLPLKQDSITKIFN